MSQSGIPHSVVQDARTTARGRKSRIGQVGQVNSRPGGERVTVDAFSVLSARAYSCRRNVQYRCECGTCGEHQHVAGEHQAVAREQAEPRQWEQNDEREIRRQPHFGDGGPRMAPPCHPRQVGRSESTVLTASPCTGGSGCGGDCVLAAADSGVLGELPRPGVHGRRHHPADRGSPTGHSALEEGVPRSRSGTDGRVAEIT